MMDSARIDKALLNRIAAGEAVFFLGAGFSLLPPELSGQKRDRAGLQETLVDQFSKTLEDAPFDVTAVSVEDLVFFLRAHKGIQAAAIAATIKDFLANRTELAALESYRLLQSLLTARPGLIDAIITTNWDKGLEESLGSLGKLNLQTIITDVDALRYDSRCLSVLKIHGDIDDASSIVLSSQDFDLYEKEHPRIVERLRVIFSTRYLVMLGYSGADANFRRIYRSIHFDLGGRSRGGWLVAPELGDREKIWAPTVGLVHVPETAQGFLKTVLSYVVTTPLGCTNKTVGKGSSKAGFFEADRELAKAARAVRKKFALNEVLVAGLRGGARPNHEIARVAALYLESRCRGLRRIALGTGETMGALVQEIDTDCFTRPVTVLSTLVMMAAPSEFRDPSHIVQEFVGRFSRGRARCFSLRLPGEEYLEELFPDTLASGVAGAAAALQAIGREQVRSAMKADVIIGSARPESWFGGGGIPRGRSVPFQMLWPGRKKKLAAMLLEERVVAIHHMIPLDNSGKDVMAKQSVQREWGDFGSMVQRPTVEDLWSASRSSRKVIIVGARAEKAASIGAIFRAGLANVAILDASLAKELLET